MTTSEEILCVILNCDEDQLKILVDLVDKSGLLSDPWWIDLRDRNDSLKWNDEKEKTFKLTYNGLIGSYFNRQLEKIQDETGYEFADGVHVFTFLEFENSSIYPNKKLIMSDFHADNPEKIIKAIEDINF